MRRRTLLVALVGLAVVVAVGALVMWPRANRVTRENYDRIQIGMSRGDVEAILGPPGDYRTGPGERGDCEVEDGTVESWMPDTGSYLYSTPSNWMRMPLEPPENQRLWASWESDSIGISITIDDSGSVVDRGGLPRRTTQGQLDNLLWRAKRQWHRWFPE
jgi:hypothetical protein